jgi:hypothetical protein
LKESLISCLDFRAIAAQFWSVRPIKTMRTIILRVSLVFILIVVCLSAYFIGYGRGHSAAVHDQLVFDLRDNLHLYKLAKSGDTNRLESNLRFLVFSCSDYYDRYFSSEKITNQYFIKDLVDARAIASLERTQVVSIDEVVRQANEAIQTNRIKNETNI